MYSHNTRHHSSSYIQLQPHPVIEEESVYGVRLTPTVYSQLVDYFNRAENLGLRQSDVIAKLLIAVDAPSNIPHQPPTFVSPTLKRSAQPSKTIPKRKSVRIGDDIGIYESIVQYEDERTNEIENEVEENDEETFYVGEYMEVEDEQSNAVASIIPGNIPTIDNYYLGTSKRSKTTTATVKKRVGRPAKTVKKSAAATSQKRKDNLTKSRNYGTGKQKPWTTNLRRLIYDILIRRRRDDLGHCRECDIWLVVAHPSAGLRCNNVLEHVCSHVGKPIMYSCRLCKHQTTTKFAIKKHVKVKHGRVNDFDDLTDNYYNELSERIRNCFDFDDTDDVPTSIERQLTFRPTVGISLSSIGQEIRRFLYTIIKKWRQENALYCRHCNRWIRMGIQQASTQTKTIFNHLCNHFDVQIYRCLICDQRMTAAYRMVSHLERAHQTTSKGNFTEELDDHGDDLKEAATKYFDWQEGTGPPQLTEKGPYLRPAWRTGDHRRTIDVDGVETSGSCILEGYAYARSLIKQFSNNSRNMRCQICEAVVIVKPQYNVPFDHALLHLDRDVYACHLCGETRKRVDYIRRHYIRKHKGEPTSNYIDKTDEMKKEILDLMKKCFDPNCTIITKKPGFCRIKALEYARRLIKDFSNEATNEMKCQICENAIIAKVVKGKEVQYRSLSVFGHVLTHLDNYAFACRICNETRKKRRNMQVHMTSCHTDLDRDDYVDRTDQMEEEIFKMMKRCYDSSFNGNMEEATTSGINVFID